MEYFVLNEHSFNLDGDASFVNGCLVTMFDVYREAVNRDFRQIRVTENIDSNWYEMDLGNQFTIRNWIENQTEKDYKTRLKSLISSTTTPIFRINDLDVKNKYSFSEFTYEGADVPVLGATFLLNQLSLSINSNQIWCSSTFSLHCLELLEEEFCESTVEVKNVTTLDHWLEHYEAIKNYRTSLAKNKDERKILIDRFEDIIFTPQAYKQVMNSDHEFFVDIWTNLQSVEDVINKVKQEKGSLNYQKLIEDCSSLRISDESDSVKQSPKLSNHRKFMHDGVRHFFGHHIKKFNGAKRLHFIVLDNKVVVGYAGKHLPTKKFG